MGYRECCSRYEEGSERIYCTDCDLFLGTHCECFVEVHQHHRYAAQTQISGLAHKRLSIQVKEKLEDARQRLDIVGTVIQSFTELCLGALKGPSDQDGHIFDELSENTQRSEKLLDGLARQLLRESSRQVDSADNMIDNVDATDYLVKLRAFWLSELDRLSTFPNAKVL